MQRWLVLWLVFGVVLSAAAERTEAIWEQRFDMAVSSLKGGAAVQDGALHTVSQPDAAEHACAEFDPSIAIPHGLDGYLLRLEWSLIPVRLGGWGQDAHVADAWVVEFTGERPTLNAQHAARDVVKAGEPVTLSCDFNVHRVFSWRINGNEQLAGPVPAWHSGATQAKVGLCDFKESQSETRWLWVRLSKVTPDDVLPVRVTGWDALPAYSPDQPAPYLVGFASAMEKVFREAADYRGSFNQAARLAAAGRERESFQLVCLPVGQALHGVNVTVSDLMREDGQGRFSSKQISWHPVGYVQTKPSNSAIRRVGCWWPDVLLPAEPFDVALGFVQPVWFTVDVPADTPAGVYRGFITLTPSDAPPQTLGLELAVRAFALPLRGALKTAFCFSPGLWEMWYQPDEVKKRLGMTDQTGHGPLYTSYECADVLPKAKWLELYDFLLAHRLSPTSIYSGLKNGRSRTVPAREDMAYCYERGMNATCLANCDVLPADAAAADQYLRDLENWLSDWEGFVQANAWPDFTWYVHGFDESEMRPNPAETVDPSIRRVFGMLGEKFPWLKRETANPLVAKHIGNFDIWTPLTAQLKGDLAGYRERQASGDEVWAYVCCGPGKPFANLFIDFPGVDPRILGWQYYQYKLSGFLYYLMNLYEYQENWNMAAPKWPDRPWNPLSFNTNSDGILMYPGPDATPLASTRLENLRDGIEDYEALTILDGLVQRLSALPAASDLIAQAREVLKVRADVSTSWTEYTQEPGRITAARAEVDGLIEAALRKLETN